MGYETRANRIMALLRKTGTAQASRISELLQVSLVTVRKDLQRMEDEGLLHRTHGGAAIREMQTTQDPRMACMERIAAAAAEEIKAGDCVIMNAGNTTLLTARKLLGRKNISRLEHTAAQQNGAGLYCRQGSNADTYNRLISGEIPAAEAIGSIAVHLSGSDRQGQYQQHCQKQADKTNTEHRITSCIWFTEVLFAREAKNMQPV